MNLWKNKDPIILEKEKLLIYKNQIIDEINNALDFAYNSPFPKKEDLLTDVI